MLSVIPKRALTTDSTQYTHRPLLLALAIAAGTLSGLAPLAIQAAEPDSAHINAQARFNIAPGPLDRVLKEFASAARITLSFNPATIGPLPSAGLQGSYGVDEALERLLAGHALQVSRTASGAYLITPTNSDQANALPAVRVSAAGLGSTSEGTSSYTTGVTTTATGLALSIRETPQTVSVVTRTQIEDQGLYNLPAVLQYTPGVTPEQYDGERYGIFARGFAVENYLLDGLPGTYGVLHQSQLDTLAFDRVEIVKGANGLMTGAGQPSASVNLVRKRPTNTLQGSLQGTLGSWDLKRLEGDISGPLNNTASVRGRLAMAGGDKDSFTDRYHRRHSAIYGVLDVDLGERTLFSLSTHYSQNEVDSAPFGGTVPMFYHDGSRIDLDRSWSQIPGWASWDTDSLLVGLELEHHFSNNWHARLAYNHQQNDSILEGVFWEGYVNQDGSGAFAWRDKHFDDSTRETLSLSLAGQFTWLDRHHDVMFGLSRVDSQSLYDNYYDWDGYEPVDFFSDIIHIPRPTDDGRFLAGTADPRIIETAAYGVTRLRATERLSVIVGTRLSNWSSDRLDNNYESGPVIETRTRYDHDNVVSPYLGAVLDVNNTYSLYASYTDIFTPQHYRDHQGDLLGPVEGLAYETGVKGAFFSNRLNTTLALFRVEQDNLGEDTGAMLNGDPVYRSIDGSIAQGLEIEVSGELSPDWQVNGGISRHTIKDAQGKAVLTHAPQTSAKLFTRYRLPAGWNRLTLGGGVRWQADIYKDNIGPNNDGIPGTADDRLQQDSYAVVDLMASYAISDTLGITLNINNLLDKEYLTAFRQGAQYGSPRYVSLSFRYRL